MQPSVQLFGVQFLGALWCVLSLKKQSWKVAIQSCLKFGEGSQKEQLADCIASSRGQDNSGPVSLNFYVSVTLDTALYSRRI